MNEEQRMPPLETEWDVLSALWDKNAATAREVAEYLETRRGWAYSTVKTMLDRMVQKGLVHARRVGNVYEYRAAINRQDATRGAWRKFVDTAFSGSMIPALQFLAKDAKLSKRQKQKLLALLEGDGNEDD